ncbi:N-acetylmuramidase domain-containing protein, partial [Sulfurimonas sp.]
AQKKQIKALSWWDEASGVKGLPEPQNVWHFHPAGFVGNFVGGGCFCAAQGKSVSCSGDGVSISNKDFEDLEKILGVEKEVLKAIALVESGSRGAFYKNKTPRHATILYERHYMKDFLDKKIGKEKRIALQKKHPDLIGNYKAGSYGTYNYQIKRLELAKKIDKDGAVYACSWGRFQVMGANYSPLYSSLRELETAQNQCETQQMALFFQFLVQNRLSSAMKNKEWRKIARKYNGPAYAKNAYHTKMETAYKKLKKNWK